MKTALIIHGHFYQPPRENPKTGIVENQPSAFPYKNWNEAVYQTSYRPNAYSRYLNPQGKILWINNNYENISVNYGPTLLKWLDSEHPNFIKKLVDADKKSIQEFGHSNFIAQCYNHTILPLDSNDIKRIEIQWALEDYRKRFGHDSEGFWCSECAIDADTIDELAIAGIKFVILSPWQATSINGVKLNGQPAPCDRAFIIKGKKHSISAFFYNPELASGISFGHYLTDADRLYARLVEIKNSSNSTLISCATDGEVYGHHEAFGDMALAALIKKVNDGDDFYITNFGSYLEKNPATEVATLFNGTKHPGSSWSCCHGVERWCSNCGCHTGGPDSWNQKWRAPLRKAFGNLESSARELISSELDSMFCKHIDFTSVMVEYGKFVVGSLSLDDFISSLENQHNRNLSDSHKNELAVLLASYKNILFSFTSCGWFFNDISGIEPQQNIVYALEAANNLQAFTKDNLKKRLFRNLSKAVSNIDSEGNGSDIAKKHDSDVPGPVLASFFFIKNKMDKHFEKFKKSYGYFNVQQLSNDQITVQDSTTKMLFSYTFSFSSLDDGVVRIEIKDKENSYSTSYKNSEAEDVLSKKEILQNVTISFANEIDKNGLDFSVASLLINALNSLRSEGVEPNISELQNVVYPFLTGKKKTNIDAEVRNSLIEKLNFAYDLF